MITTSRSMLRFKVPHQESNVIALKDIKAEVELGFDDKLAFAEAQQLFELRCADCLHRQIVH